MKEHPSKTVVPWCSAAAPPYAPTLPIKLQLEKVVGWPIGLGKPTVTGAYIFVPLAYDTQPRRKTTESTDTAPPPPVMCSSPAVPPPSMAIGPCSRNCMVNILIYSRQQPPLCCELCKLNHVNNTAAISVEAAEQHIDHLIGYSFCCKLQSISNRLPQAFDI